VSCWFAELPNEARCAADSRAPDGDVGCAVPAVDGTTRVGEGGIEVTLTSPDAPREPTLPPTPLERDAALPLAELREEAMARANYRCEWPGNCQGDDLQMAHLEHRGRGGGDIRNRLDNVTILCERHHSILDGRTVAGRKYEVAVLLAAWLGLNDNAHGLDPDQRRTR
jgi:hypothetical protein